MAGNTRCTVLVLVLALVGFSQGADFFTGMDRHIGCFYDKLNDRYSCTPVLEASFLNLLPQGLGSKSPTD